MSDLTTQPRARRARARVVTRTLALCACALLVAIPAEAARRPVIGPYFAAPFKVTKLHNAFGHGASWATNGDVLSTQFDRAGILQIYRAKLNGNGQRCLTCRTVPGPNGLPQERPQGGWIL